MESGKKRYITTFAVAAIIIFIFFFRVDGTEEMFVPEELSEARMKSASISERIVDLSRDSIETLKEIRRAELAGEYNEALDLVMMEIEQNEQARKEALDLSYELTHIAERLEEVRPKEAAEVGLQATIYAAQITQRLINYNTYTLQLFDTLRSHFVAGSSSEEISASVQDIIVKMNEEAQAINALNGEYKEAMRKFDLLTVAE
jgi:hypothetical protein